MTDIESAVATSMVIIELSMHCSDKITNLKDRLAEMSITKSDEVIGLCTLIVEYYKFVEKNELVLSERSKNHEN